jgi:hypothetical protein
MTNQYEEASTLYLLYHHGRFPPSFLRLLVVAVFAVLRSCDDGAAVLVIRWLSTWSKLLVVAVVVAGYNSIDRQI